MMTRFALSRSALPAVAVLLGLLVTPARAQGTPAQREACAPDAIRLCQATIPDVPRTTVCMRTHLAELSPRCRTAFLDATRDRQAKSPRPAKPSRQANKSPRSAAKRREARLAVPSNDRMPGPRYLMPGDRTSAADARRARNVVRRLCRADILDRDTCAFTNKMIDLAR